MFNVDQNFEAKQRLDFEGINIVSQSTQGQSTQEMQGNIFNSNNTQVGGNVHKLGQEEKPPDEFTTQIEVIRETDETNDQWFETQEIGEQLQKNEQDCEQTHGISM